MSEVPVCAPSLVKAAFTDHIRGLLEARDTHSGEQRALGVGLLQEAPCITFTRKPGPDSGPSQDQDGCAFLNHKPRLRKKDRKDLACASLKP